MISFDSEFHSFDAVAENDLSKREVLDLRTARSHFSLTANYDCDFQMWVEMYSRVRSFNALKVINALL